MDLYVYLSTAHIFRSLGDSIDKSEWHFVAKEKPNNSYCPMKREKERERSIKIYCIWFQSILILLHFSETIIIIDSHCEMSALLACLLTCLKTGNDKFLIVKRTIYALCIDECVQFACNFTSLGIVNKPILFITIEYFYYWILSSCVDGEWMLWKSVNERTENRLRWIDAISYYISVR